MQTVIAVKELEKSYGRKKAVDRISFEIFAGEIIGLLGPNGAGKSTTINVLGTLLSPDSGEISLMGHNLKSEKKEIKRAIGIVPQDIAIFEDISAEQNVRFFASLYGNKGPQLTSLVQEALELVGLSDKKDDKPKTFSGGMKRRLNIACAIAHKPQLIIMDEPTVGIDPQSRNHILESIKTLRDNGATIIYSTHYMEEVEAIADRIIIMNEGKIIAEGTKEELISRIKSEVAYIFKVSDSNFIDMETVLSLSGVLNGKLENDKLTLKCKGKHVLSEVITAILACGCTIEEMFSEEASLETVFLDLTGRKLRD